MSYSYSIPGSQSGGRSRAITASLAVVNVICAIIERIAVNRSFIKSLNLASGNAVGPGSVRLSFAFTGLPHNNDFIYNKIKLLLVIFLGRVMALIVMGLTDARGRPSNAANGAFPA
ncbi:hypothetical protein [Raoultella planticola]|uniref:hypothetical protein n=1 Tax=Raoultella planticola TaxID=575 RepID=UPI0036D4BD6D